VKKGDSLDIETIPFWARLWSVAARPCPLRRVILEGVRKATPHRMLPSSQGHPHGYMPTTMGSYARPLFPVRQNFILPNPLFV
jgi:hypothetical protein